VPKGLFSAAIVLLLTLVALVVYVTRIDVPGFAGYWNLLYIGALNVILAVFVFRALNSPKTDPYQANEDREERMAGHVRLALWTSVALSSFLMLTFSLQALDLGAYIPIAMSFYFQLLALLVFRDTRLDDVNFEVYRDDPATA
jgi:hypothetical protein